jgi:glycosyltransferase involved in cell wall biosynthesis
MHERGHEVTLLAYDGPSELDDGLRQVGVDVRVTRATRRREKLAAVRAAVRELRPDVMHGVMKRASSLAVMARSLLRRPRIVATDMSTATFNPNQRTLRAALVAFGFADRVVTQTELNRRNLERLAPWLRGRVQVIRNGLDTERFTPADRARHPPGEPFHFCAVGTVYPVKNPVRVLEALAELRRRGTPPFRLDWYGRVGRNEGEHEAMQATVRNAVEALNLRDVVTFHGEVGAVEAAYRSADALVHVSVQEGFPNAVAEAMACGLPVVVSDVSDLPLVVQTAENGFVCDPQDVASIAAALERMLHATPDARLGMAERSRALARSWFGYERFAGDFERLYRELVGVR